MYCCGLSHSVGKILAETAGTEERMVDMKTRMKRVLSICVMAALAVSMTTVGVSAAAAPASSANTSAETGTNAGTQSGILDYSQIDFLVRNNNLQVKNNEITRKNMSKNGNDALKDAQEGLQDAVDQFESLSSSMNTVIAWATQKLAEAGTPGTPGYDAKAAQEAQMMLTLAGGNKASLSMLAGNLDSQLEQMKVTNDQRALVNIQLDQVDAQLVSAAQSLFSVCKQMELNLEQASLSRPLLESSLKIAQVNVSQGTGTQLQVTEAQLALAELDQNIAQLQNQLANLKAQLNTTLGRSYNTPFTLGDLPQPDLTYYQNANLANDIKTAMSNNYTIRYQQEELSQMDNDDDYSSIDREMQAKRNEIAMEQSSLQVAMTNQYNTIAAAQSTYQLQQQKYQAAKTKYDQAVLTYQVGMSSKLEMESAKADYLSAKSAMDNAQMDLFTQIESYKGMVKGLPASTK